MQESGRIDLNADLGEEVGDDAGLLAVVTSANVACGYHAGTRETMARICEEAARRGVVIGAHVSYADRANFGRRAHEVAPEVLREQVADQVGTLIDVALAVGAEVGYLKPHGALYHRVHDDETQARAVLAGSGTLAVLSLPGARIAQVAQQAGRPTYVEGFPDRGYGPDGRLLRRDQPGALLHDTAHVAAQAARLAPVVDSLCVHGDSPDAVAHAVAARTALTSAGWHLAPFLATEAS